VLRALTLAAVTATLASGAAAGPRGGTAVVFVSAERASQLVGVDPATGRVLARIRVPTGPHNVASYRERYVLVTSPPAGAVTLVDAFTRRVVRTWRGFGYPHDVEIAGDFAYVTDEARGELVVIGLRARKVRARLAVGARPHDVAVGDVTLVTHGAGRASLTVVDTRRPAAPRVIGSLAAGGAAHDISRRAGAALAHVTYWGSGSVGAVDWRRERLRWRRALGSLIHHVQVDPHGRRLFATDHGTGQVFLLSTRDGRVLRRLGECPGAHHVVPVGTAWVAVACHDADALAVWNARTWRRTLVPVGDGPHGVAVAVLP